MLYNKNNLLVCLATSKNANRPELNGVYFKKDKTIATDSYVLVEVKNPSEMANQAEDLPELPDKSKPFTGFPNKGLIIPAKSVAKVIKNLAEVKNDNLPVLNNCWFIAPKTPDTSTIITTDLEKTDSVTVKNVDGSFPETNQVIDKAKSKANQKVVVDIKKMKQVIDTIDKMDLPDQAIISISVPDKNDPVLIQAQTRQGQEINALVMPVQS